MKRRIAVKPKQRTLNEAEMDKRREKRPVNYAELPPKERKKIDEALGLIDPESGISIL